MENSEFCDKFDKNDLDKPLSVENLNDYMKKAELSKVWAELSGNLNLSSLPIHTTKIFDLLKKNKIVKLNEFHNLIQNLQENAKVFFENFYKNLREKYINVDGSPSLEIVYLLLKYTLENNIGNITCGEQNRAFTDNDLNNSFNDAFCITFKKSRKNM